MVKHARTRLALSLLAAWTLLAAVPALARADRLVVQRDPGLSAAQRADVRSDAGVRLAATLPIRDAEVVAVPTGEAARALSQLNRDPRVRQAAPDVSFRVATADPPGDPYWTDQWGLSQASGIDVDALDAWDFSRGAGVTVAVVDTGVESTHEDLRSQVRTDGKDYVDRTGSTEDQDGHGTEVAGVIAAESDNGRGIAGLAPEAQILPLRAFSSTTAYLDQILSAFDDAGRRGIRVVSASFSTNPGEVTDPSVGSMIEHTLAAHPNTLYVVAAGNERTNVDSTGEAAYPCDVTSPNLICVGAHTSTDHVELYSNTGPASVDLFAPGWNIKTTSIHNSYTTDTGTSLATPFVSAEAALLFSAIPQLTAVKAKALILDNTRRVAAYDGRSLTGGAADAGAAVAAAIVDHDGDTVPDVVDACPGEHGSPTAVGCPDADGDGVADSADACPGQAGSRTAAGCPDADGDGVQDAGDACPNAAGTGRADGCPDTDGDGLIDSADGCPTVAGTVQGCPDHDGDGIADSADACPYQSAATANGCPVVAVTSPPSPVVTAVPTPTVPVRIVSVAVKVAHNRKTARVTVRLTRTAGTAVTMERRVKRGHRHVWTRVLRRSFSATAAGRGMTVRTRKRGSYRVTVALAGARTVRHDFRV